MKGRGAKRVADRRRDFICLVSFDWGDDLGFGGDLGLGGRGVRDQLSGLLF